MPVLTEQQILDMQRVAKERHSGKRTREPHLIYPFHMRKALLERERKKLAQENIEILKRERAAANLLENDTMTQILRADRNYFKKRGWKHNPPTEKKIDWEKVRLAARRA